jgi:hypothetical protein
MKMKRNLIIAMIVAAIALFAAQPADAYRTICDRPDARRLSDKPGDCVLPGATVQTDRPSPRGKKEPNGVHPQR